MARAGAAATPSATIGAGAPLAAPPGADAGIDSMAPSGAESAATARLSATDAEAADSAAMPRGPRVALGGAGFGMGRDIHDGFCGGGGGGGGGIA